MPAVPQQKHCLLIAASNPYRLSTPVLRPLVLFNANGQPEYQTEQWWSADADAVSKAFPAVILSTISFNMSYCRWKLIKDVIRHIKDVLVILCIL